jgi:plasmid maintenance system killer protein
VARRVSNILDRLHTAVQLSELETLTGFHWLSGNRAQECAVTVTHNWRITFTPVTDTIVNAETGEAKEEFNVQDVDFEDYH